MPWPATGAVFILTYLVGGIPFGYLLARWRGVDLFQVGSGNIGATNTARALGWKYGVVCFVLDFLKGAVPVWLAGWLGASDTIRVGVAALAFLGHLFPIYLGFRGGKGVATGAGTITVLVPVPAAIAVFTWLLLLICFRYVSLASLAAVLALLLSRLILTPEPFAPGRLAITLYCLAGGSLVAVKHLGNIRRLSLGTETQVGDHPMRHTIIKAVHLLALGLWFGGAAFFNFGTAVPIFASFQQVVMDGPSDRTAYVTIVPADAPAETKLALASALAGAAVGPVFPRYFAMQAVCGATALLTSLVWWNRSPGRRSHRIRVLIISIGWILVLVSWPISDYVSELRLERFHPDPATAAAARQDFATWHLLSLGLSLLTTAIAALALGFAAKLPADPNPENAS
jgi:glycerol-3-phosphate acyltransferase PlsY